MLGFPPPSNATSGVGRAGRLSRPPERTTAAGKECRVHVLLQIAAVDLAMIYCCCCGDSSTGHSGQLLRRASAKKTYIGCSVVRSSSVCAAAWGLRTKVGDADNVFRAPSFRQGLEPLCAGVRRKKLWLHRIDSLPFHETRTMEYNTKRGIAFPYSGAVYQSHKAHILDEAVKEVDSMLSENLANKFRTPEEYKDIDGMLFSATSPGGSPGGGISETPIALSVANRLLRVLNMT